MTAVSGSSRQSTLKKRAMRSAMRAASQLYLEVRPLMWMMPLHLHVNKSHIENTMNAEKNRTCHLEGFKTIEETRKLTKL